MESVDEARPLVASDREGSLGLACAARGAAVTAGCVTAYAVLTSLLGPPLLEPDAPLGVSSGARATLVSCALVGFLLGVRRYEVRADDFAALAPYTGLSAEDFRALRTTRPVSPLRRWTGRAVGILCGLAIVPASSSNPSFVLDPAQYQDAGLLFAFAINGALFSVLADAITHAGASPETRVATAIRRVDLLDRELLRPFARVGLRRAFFWAGGSSIASLLALDLEVVGPLFVVIALTLTMSTIAVLAACRPIQRRIREQKARELRDVRARVLETRETALRARGAQASGAAAELPGLLAWEARLERVSEWPFDTAMRLRFAGLAALAVGSWLGGALVERGLSLLLG